MQSNSNSGIVPTRLYLQRSGLNMVLGPLELQVMQIMWKADGKTLSNKEVAWRLSQVGRTFALPTVGNTMHRLAAKGYVIETKLGGLFVYTATMTEDELEMYTVTHILSRLRKSWPDLFDDAVLDTNDMPYFEDER